MTKAVELAQVASTGVSEAFKNRVINGAMSVSQRGTSFTNVGSGSPPTYTLDRWFGFRGGFAANLDISQQTGFETFQNCLRMQRTSGTSGTQGMQINQIIETNNCFDMAGQTATLSVTIRAGANYSGGVVSIGIQTSTATNASSPNLANGEFAAGSFTATPTITTTATTYTATGVVPSNARTIAISISWVPTGTAGANDFIELTGVQLEVGSSATSFEYLNYQTLLSQCQRYCMAYRADASTNFTYFSIGQVMSSTESRQVFEFKQTMRSLPTVTTSAANTFIWDPAGGGITVTGLTLDRVTPEGGTLGTTVASSSLSAQQCVRMIQNSTNTCFVIFSAEL